MAGVAGRVCSASGVEVADFFVEVDVLKYKNRRCCLYENVNVLMDWNRRRCLFGDVRCRNRCCYFVVSRGTSESYYPEKGCKSEDQR